ncbi:hypothetical protein A2U01_0036417, partial [Trifolium medium]|nr:hypothetical protein [Trifolium medium]
RPAVTAGNPFPNWSSVELRVKELEVQDSSCDKETN